MTDNKPFFRFHPGAYEAMRNCFVRSTDPCSLCGLPCVWLHVGRIYGPLDPAVCARCIANGDLMKTYGDLRFVFHDAQLDGADPALKAEVMQGTPGFSTFNPFRWPVLDGKPLAFFGHGEEKATWTDPAAEATVVRLYKDVLGVTLTGPTPYALVFREIDGPRYIAELDMD